MAKAKYGIKVYLAVAILSKRWWKWFWSGSAGDLLFSNLSITILTRSIDGRNTSKAIWSKKIYRALNKLINISANKIESKLTPEFPTKILFSKFGIKIINKEIIIAT